MKYVLWLVKAAIFFTLFAFALNNQQQAAVHFFFGHQWQAPMVLIVLMAFAAGLVVGVLGMLPHWWRNRRKPASSVPVATPSSTQVASSPQAEPEPVFVQPDAPADRPLTSPNQRD